MVSDNIVNHGDRVRLRVRVDGRFKVMVSQLSWSDYRVSVIKFRVIIQG